MKTSFLSTFIKELFNLDFSRGGEQEIALVKQKTLRKLVGIMGMLLPIILWLSVNFVSGSLTPLDSISHYYYTRYGSILIIVVSVLAIFLLVYKGYDIEDFLLSSFAGIGALLLVFLPTDNIKGLGRHVARFDLPENCTRIVAHFIASGIFLLSLAIISIVVFTRSNKESNAAKGKEKLIRNFIYRLCGILMLLAMLVIVIGTQITWSFNQFYTEHQLTFWMETLAIEAFGFSWLVKGELIFKDNKSNSSF